MPRSKIWKDSLYQGTFVTPNGRIFRCEDTDQRHFLQRVKAMSACGTPIPWVWEHQPGDEEADKNLSAADLIAKWAQNTGGHIHDARIKDGVLEFQIDVDDSDKKKLEAVKFVSPQIRHNWRDRNGPSWDDKGPFWPGPSIAHLAVTPIPVQYPQRAFNFDGAMSLSCADVTISLSSAKYAPDDKDKAMPNPKKKPGDPPVDDADDTLDDSDMDAGADDAGDLDTGGGGLGADLDGNGTIDVKPVTDATKDEGYEGKVAAAIVELTSVFEPMGIMFHASASDDALAMLQHVITAVKTHKATKDGAENDKDDDDDQNQDQDRDPNAYQEPEITEGAPIQMSALSPREQMLAKKIHKDTVANLHSRIGVLHAKGFIDDEIKADLAKQVSQVPMNLSAEGEIVPVACIIAIEAYERVMKKGKAGSFAAPSKQTPTASKKPNKPISAAMIQLSATEEVAVDPPYDADLPTGGDAGQPVDKDIVNRMSGGRYSEYLAKKTAGAA